MAKPLDFIMRKVLDNKLRGFGVEGSSSSRRTLDLSAYGELGSVTSVDLHLGSGDTTATLDDDKVWVTGTLVKFPSDVLSRGPTGLDHKKAIYTLFIKSPKDLGEYVNEAVSAEVEAYFSFNEHIILEGEQVTVLNSYQAPSVYIDGKTGRYWNRVLIECEMFYINN